MPAKAAARREALGAGAGAVEAAGDGEGVAVAVVGAGAGVFADVLGAVVSTRSVSEYTKYSLCCSSDPPRVKGMNAKRLVRTERASTLHAGFLIRRLDLLVLGEVAGEAAGVDAGTGAGDGAATGAFASALSAAMSAQSSLVSTSSRRAVAPRQRACKNSPRAALHAPLQAGSNLATICLTCQICGRDLRISCCRQEDAVGGVNLLIAEVI